MYEVVKEFIGDLPSAFEFIYAIVTLVLSTLTISFLFQLFYIPLNMFRRR